MTSMSRNNRAIALLAKLASAAALTFAAPMAQAVDWNGYQVNIIRSPDGRPCTFFQLVGVAQADPVKPNDPWFVIRQAHPGYKEMLAILMSAKLTSRNVIVSTAGSVPAECGEVEAYVVQLP